MIEAFVHAWSTLFHPATLGVISVGVIIGLAVGILPGLGGAATLALLLPFIWKSPAEMALPLLVALKASVFMGGGITAILLNIPGEATSPATLIDGYPMNQKGEGGRVIGAAVVSSMAVGIAAVPMALIMIPLIAPIVMNFKSPEILFMIIMGISFIAVLTGESMIKGLISGGLGILLSFIGMHEVTGISRFTFGSIYLYNGLSIPTVVMGWFGLSEMIDLVWKGQTSISKIEIARVKYRDILVGARDVMHHWWLWVRSSVIGYIVGVLPGVGPGTSIWIAYGHAKQTSKHPERFGTGCVEGVIAPEASNGASTAGDLLTTMAFGIPGSLGMAVLMGGFILVGVNPGPVMMAKNLDLALTLLLGIALANIIAGLLCLAGSRSLAKIAFIHLDFLYPIVLTIIFVAAFVTAGAMLDIVMVRYMQIKPSSYFLMLILLFTGAVIGSSLTFRYFESTLLPLIVGGLVFIMGSFELWRELAAGRAAPKKGEEPEVKRTNIGSTLAWLLGFAGAIYLVGFVITVPLYLLSYLRWRKRSWPTAIAVAAFTTIAMFVIFEIGFRTELWKGLLFS